MYTLEDYEKAKAEHADWVKRRDNYKGFKLLLWAMCGPSSDLRHVSLHLIMNIVCLHPQVAFALGQASP